MDLEPRPLTEGLGAWLSESADSGHPDVETLVRYHQNELDAVTRDPVVEHLARCLDCAEEVLDLAAFDAALDAAPAASRTGQADRAEDWHAFRSRLEATSAEGAWSPGRQQARPWHWPVAVAASLLLGLGLGYLGVTRQAPEPVIANVEIVELRSETLRSEPEPYRLSFTERTEHVALILSAPDVTAHNAHSCTIVDQAGQPVWSADWLEPTPYGTFTLLLSRRAVAVGRYHIELYGIDGVRRTRLASYPLEIAHDGKQ